jgi:outer membrane murein-binding lipoprotein Lpp
MPVTDTDFAELTSRVTRLERASVNNTETIGWLAGTLGGMKAVQDDHTQRLDRIETDVQVLKSDVAILKSDVSTLKSDVAILKSDVGSLKADLRGLIINMPSIVADAMRDVMRKS